MVEVRVPTFLKSSIKQEIIIEQKYIKNKIL